MTKIEPGMIAVVTGGGAGMGRQLCVQLSSLGCKVATCDINEKKLKETVAECRNSNLSADVFTFKCDVSKEDECLAFKDATLTYFKSSHINLLFNNAGISGGGSFVIGERKDWDDCFNVCWFGVYYMSRAFMPSLIKAKSGHITNTSSANGLFASIGTHTPHTSYSAAKFAVRGFTEALITDLRLNAPHIGVSLICPGHIGTDIALNSQQKFVDDHGDRALQSIKRSLLRRGIPDEIKEQIEKADNKKMMEFVNMMGYMFKNNGMSASDAATYILNAVQAGQWRVLPGKDVNELDEYIRRNPENIYEVGHVDKILKFFEQDDNSNLAEQEEMLGIDNATGKRNSRL